MSTIFFYDVLHIGALKYTVESRLRAECDREPGPESITIS